MFSRISNAWSLAKSSWALLQKDRELAWLPVIGGVAALVVGGIFFGPFVAMLDVGGEEATVPVAGYILAFLGYVAVAATFMLARAAVIHGANTRMDGTDPTVGSSIGGSLSRWPAVAGFAAISVTVGLILSAIRESGGIIGGIISFIGDVAWSVITYLVLPIIVVEGIGTIDGIKGSTALVKRTWGEQVTANIGFGLLNMLLILPAIGVGVVAASAGGIVAVIGIAVAVAWAVAASAVITTLTAIFQTALYRQATGRTVPAEFDAAALTQSFSRRR